ncbi:GMC family oxidoreductase N-terminal domain-containing protein [Serratia bockelmannii]|uniref:GMC family oxidoreductase n=1 Tax=Serratia TaxID=613 RepID=UPI001EF8FCF5|nr:GMC family oxidoreductase N-terminal domain-containing protein [Serratia marcescens]
MQKKEAKQAYSQIETELNRRSFVKNSLLAMAAAGTLSSGALASVASKTSGKAGGKADEFDVIVVGGGSGGAVVASRLSENPQLRVLLIEAGPTFSAEHFPPVLAKREMVGGGDYVWEKQASTGTDHTNQHLRAKVLGGGSAINAAAFVRAPKFDFDRWTQQGLKGWSYEEVLPYFKRMESANYGADAYHGRNGPMPVRLPRLDHLSPASQAFYHASVAHGLRANDDINGADPSGVAIYPVNVVDGIRMNTAMTYLRPEVRQRSNLEILGNRMVDKVLLENKRVVGVQLSDGGRLNAANVFLCAGSAGSPAILMRSGVGPADDLKALDIPLVIDLPVGRNLHEQPTNGILVSCDPKLGTYPPIGTTLWARSSIAEAGELDIFISNNHFVNPELFPTKAGFQLFFAVGRPYARGNLKLASRDPLATPRIDLNLLGDERDLLRMIELCKLSREILAEAPLKAISKGEVPRSLGGKVALSESEIREEQKSTVMTNLHLSSTAPMGMESDPFAVLDAHGKVLGLEGLYVSDASVFPDVPSQATNPDVIMAAEYLSALFINKRA